MGMFKNMKDLTDVMKQGKEMGDAALEQQGIRKGFMGTPHLGGSLAKMKDMMGDVAQMQGKNELLATGTPGKARVLGLTDTGMEVNNNRVVEVRVEVTVEGADTYTAVIRDSISPILMPQVQPGATVPVRVDAADRDSVVFDWARTAMM
jgi:hypothetical protein